MLNHAPDLRKNETLVQDRRNSSASASDNASRYFTDLQHLRKKFWERYRHLLIPMIRTQIEKSGIKRLTRTATSHGLRQTKRSGEASRSNFLEEFRAPSVIIPKMSPLTNQIGRSWGIWGYKVYPNTSYPLGKFHRFGRSKTPILRPRPSSKKTSSEGITKAVKSGEVPESTKEKIPSVLKYLAYSVLSK